MSKQNDSTHTPRDSTKDAVEEWWAIHWRACTSTDAKGALLDMARHIEIRAHAVGEVGALVAHEKETHDWAKELGLAQAALALQALELDKLRPIILYLKGMFRCSTDKLTTRIAALLHDRDVVQLVVAELKVAQIAWARTQTCLERDLGAWQRVALAPQGGEKKEIPVPMVLHCPECRMRHIDVGEFVTKPHHTHACQGCGLVWRPAIGVTVGVRFLPGFMNAEPWQCATPDCAASNDAQRVTCWLCKKTRIAADVETTETASSPLEALMHKADCQKRHGPHACSCGHELQGTQVIFDTSMKEIEP